MKSFTLLLFVYATHLASADTNDIKEGSLTKVRLNASTISSHPRHATLTSTPEISSASSIPGVVALCSFSPGVAPCKAFCNNTDTACVAAASKEVQTCSPLWAAYSATLSNTRSLPTGYTLATTTAVFTAATETVTSSSWTTFSTSNATFVYPKMTGSGVTTITPVYAMGQPIVEERQSSITDWWTYTTILGPTPDCSFTSLEILTAIPRASCGQCTLTGGTVELFFWPPTPTFSGAHPTTKIASSSVGSIIMNGTTFLSPSAYISFQTAYASNSCSQVGAAHTGALLALPPEEVSTQIHWGGKAYGTGANAYGRMNFADLTGVVPASIYETQQSCLMFGCPTIYPEFNPTLVVPSQMRSLDPAWKDCAINLFGL
jgi:hypothetical protein